MRFLALFVALALLLSGCAFPGGNFRWNQTVPYSEMQYTRPDLEAMEHKLNEVIAFSENSPDASALMQAVYSFYDIYDSYLTDWYLADLHYSADLTDSYWEAEYNFCSENVPQLDAALERLYMALAVCPLREKLEKDYFGEGFFDAYEGEATLDETYTALLEEEARLEELWYGDVAEEAFDPDYEEDSAEQQEYVRRARRDHKRMMNFELASCVAVVVVMAVLVVRILGAF